MRDRWPHEIHRAPLRAGRQPLELKTDIPITDAERSRAQAENWKRHAELFKAIGRSARVTGADLSAVDRMARYEKDIGDEEARRQRSGSRAQAPKVALVRTNTAPPSGGFLANSMADDIVDVKFGGDADQRKRSRTRAPRSSRRRRICLPV